MIRDEHMKFLNYSIALVDLLHAGLSDESGGLLGGGGSRGSVDNVGVDRETERDHSVDSGGERRGVVEGETRGEERGLVEEEGEVSDGLVGLVLGDLGLELLDDGVVGVDLCERRASRRGGSATQEPQKGHRCCLNLPHVFLEAMYDDMEESRRA